MIEDLKVIHDKAIEYFHNQLTLESCRDIGKLLDVIPKQVTPDQNDMLMCMTTYKEDKESIFQHLPR